MKIQFVSADDWIAMYVDGLKKVEGHSLAYFHILEALGLPYEDSIHVHYDPEKEWIDFAEDIKYLAVYKYE